MSAMGLPARIGYAVLAAGVSGVAMFYLCMQWLPQYAADHPEYDPGIDGYGIFKTAIYIAVGVALSFFLPVLTLPWIRHRKRRARGWRMGAAGVLVVVASLLFADQGFGLLYDLAVAAWLAYLMAFTFVRYGLTDDERRSSALVLTE